MTAAVALARVLLAGVFLVAALSKLVDRAGSRRALRGFHVPGALVEPAVWLLPVVEAGIAVGLLAPRTVRAAALAAFVLLALFDVVVIRAIRAGTAPPCHCFGSARAEPVSWWTVARNVALGAVALVVFAATDGEAVVRGTAPAWVAVLLGGVLVAASVALVPGRGRDGDISEPEEPVVAPSGHGAAERSSPPLDLASLVVTGPDGSSRPLTDLLHPTGETVIIGTAPGCKPCAALGPRVRSWQGSLASELGIVVVQWGRVGDLPPDAAGQVWAIDARTFAGLGFEQTPSAVAVGGEGTAPDEVVIGSEAVEVLVRRALRRSAV